MSVDSVLNTNQGLVIAPAGCGKTHLITQTLAIPQTKPYLVLTHTTAGVAALKQRLKQLQVPKKNYVVATIDGWARQVANSFPVSCNIKSAPETPGRYYPELRKQVLGCQSACKFDPPWHLKLTHP